MEEEKVEEKTERELAATKELQPTSKLEFMCTSCNVHIRAKDNFVRFYCPSCGKALIVRCANCKDAGVTYKCPNPDCGFEGP